MLEEYDVDPGSGAAAFEALYVYGRGLDEPVMMRRDVDGDGVFEDYYYRTDPQNSVRFLTRDGEVVEAYSYGSDITPYVSLAGGPLQGYINDYGWPTFVAADGSLTLVDVDHLGLSTFASDNPTTPHVDETGEPIQSAYGNPYLFNGRRWDPELGLYYYRNRYLDPLAGRFTTRDPLGIWGDPMNLGNPYTYVGNNPWTYVDPFGLQGQRSPYDLDGIMNGRGAIEGGRRLADQAVTEAGAAVNQTAVTLGEVATEELVMLPLTAGSGGTAPVVRRGLSLQSVGRFLRSVGEACVNLVRRKPSRGRITFVDEAGGMSDEARAFQSAALGARSNRVTTKFQAPTLQLTLPDGSQRTVHFDGFDGTVLIDRKRAVTGHANTLNQALKQSHALAQNGYTGRWEVATEGAASRARKTFEKLGIENIEVRVVEE